MACFPDEHLAGDYLTMFGSLCIGPEIVRKSLAELQGDPLPATPTC